MLSQAAAIYFISTMLKSQIFLLAHTHDVAIFNLVFRKPAASIFEFGISPFVQAAAIYFISTMLKSQIFLLAHTM